MSEQITGNEARQRIVRNVALLKHDYNKLWQRYRVVVHENAILSAENDRLRRQVNL